MAALTWRNVDDPDFSPALQGFQQFSQMLNGALSTAKSGLKEYDDITTDSMNKALALELAAAHGDPEAYKAALPGLLAKYDPRRLSYENITAANNKVGQLSQEALTALNLEDTKLDMADEKYGRDRKYARDAAIKAAGPLLAKYWTMANGPDTAGNRAALAKMEADPEFQTQLANVDPEYLADALGKGVGFQSGRLGLDNSRIAQARGTTEWNQSQTAYLEKREAEKLATEAFNATGGTSASALLGYIQQKTNNPYVQQAAMQLIPGYQGFFLPELEGVTGGGSVGGSSGGIPSEVVMNYEARAKGFDAIPASVQTLGQARAFAKQVNRAGASSSAMGLFQITGDTMEEFGQKVFGKDWQTTPWNAETQDKIGEAIFNASRGSAAALRGRWVSLSPQEAEQLRKQPWSQARQVIGRKESGAIISAGKLAAQAAGVLPIGAANAGDPLMSELGSHILEGWTDKTPAVDVAAGLIKSGRFEGAKKGAVLNELRSVMDKYHVNANVAGAMISMSIIDQTWGDWFQQGVYPSTYLGGASIDKNRMELLGKTLREEPQALSNALQATAAQEQEMARAAAAPAQVQALQTRLNGLLSRQSNGVKGLEREIAATATALEQAGYAGSGSLAQVLANSGFQPPAPPAPKRVPAPVRRPVATNLTPWTPMARVQPVQPQRPQRKLSPLDATIASIWGPNSLRK